MKQLKFNKKCRIKLLITPHYVVILLIIGFRFPLVFSLTYSDIALIKNNAKVGAEIAVEHAKLSNPAFRYWARLIHCSC